MNKGVITSEGYHLQKSGDRVSTLLSRHYVVPTLDSPPNENTLAWNDDSYMVNFRIGEFARVATDNGYVFYRLDDIAENKASWQELTSEDLSNYYTKDEINGLLSGLDPDIPQPDWNAREEEEGFIANRTHYYKTVTHIGIYQLASLNAGDLIVSDLNDDAVYLIQNTASNISHIEELIPTEGNRVAIPADGPTIYAVVTRDDEGKLNLVLENNYGISNYIKIEKAYIGKQLCERFLPEQIARTKDVEKVTAVENHYAPAEDASSQLDAEEGYMVIGLKRDAAGHIVGLVTAPAPTGGGETPDLEGYVTDTELQTAIAEAITNVLNTEV